MKLMQIPFNKPYTTGKELEYIEQVIGSGHLSGDGTFTKKCQAYLQGRIGCIKALLTHSCTAALELAAILIDIKPGDEVIMSSFTFVSTANAFVLRGGVPVFIDIRPDTMSLDESLIEAAITRRTRAIVPVHYAGVACEMDKIMAIAGKHNLLVIEDAAQAIMASYKGRPLGSIGHLAALSFHETKNLHCGEGGALLINDERFIERAEIIREKGTDRSKFLRGDIDKYTWVDIGSSYLPSEISAAFLFAQFEGAELITDKLLTSWDCYYEGLKFIADKDMIQLPCVPVECNHNAHLFYLKTSSLNSRTALINQLREQGINPVFHYIPLHTSRAGKKYGRFHGEDKYTTKESEKLLRLPLYADINHEDIESICSLIVDYYL